MTTPTAPPGGNAGPGGPRRRRKPPKRAEVVSVSPVTPRLLSVLVTGDELDGFADAAPTSHLKVFLPAAAGRPHLHAAPLRPGHQDPGDPVPAARRRAGVGLGAGRQAGGQARGGR